MSEPCLGDLGLVLCCFVCVLWVNAWGSWCALGADGRHEGVGFSQNVMRSLRVSVSVMLCGPACIASWYVLDVNAWGP
jgi:hypothetical protein